MANLPQFQSVEKSLESPEVSRATPSPTVMRRRRPKIPMGQAIPPTIPELDDPDGQGEGADSDTTTYIDTYKPPAPPVSREVLCGSVLAGLTIVGAGIAWYVRRASSGQRRVRPMTPERQARLAEALTTLAEPFAHLVTGTVAGLVAAGEPIGSHLAEGPLTLPVGPESTSVSRSTIPSDGE